MSELPRTDDLPRAEDGLDPARVEEAFDRFGERVRELESVAADLRAELRALRAERPPPAPAPYSDEEWPDAAGPPADWVGTIPPPLVRTFAVPRLALETVFLLGVALFAGLADLSPEWIVGLMAGAWLLVVLSEWTAAAKRSRWRLEEIPPAVETPREEGASDSTGPWSMPVVEATVVEEPDASESHTVVAALPAAAETTDETPAEEGEGAAAAVDEPAAERHRWWRRKAPGPQPADPWET